MYDVIIIGAGAAGLMCASLAGRRGLKVLILEHNDRPGKKILISGGGRCNFTNIHTGPQNFVSENPHFAKSALSRFDSSDFIKMIKDHKISFHEKKLGQLFCTGSASQIVKMLLDECHKSGVEIRLGCKVKSLAKSPIGHFIFDTDQGSFQSKKLVMATGGLSFPKIGASDFGYRIAKQFGIQVTNLSPALDGFTLGGEFSFLKNLSGVSLDCILTCENKISFRENILFTHKGLSGPAALQGSLQWKPGESIFLNILPEIDVHKWLREEKLLGSKKHIKNLLAEFLPIRFSESFCFHFFPDLTEIRHVPDKSLVLLAEKLTNWKITPSGTVGYAKAEVTRGGVDTNELSSKTMEAKKVPGLYFIGEVIDVTGWLGGYNFQWAWASAYAAAMDL
jgi:predicted Rossmann fold flavoprotein